MDKLQKEFKSGFTFHPAKANDRKHEAVNIKAHGKTRSQSPRVGLDSVRGAGLQVAFGQVNQ